MKLSIIIPTLNEEKAIAKTIGQFRSLSVEHEVIVSDGKSTDRTVEEAQAHADKVVVLQGEKHSAGIQRNDGVKASSGEILLFVDSDTYVENLEESVKKALELFAADPSLDGIATQQHVIPDIAHFVDAVVYGFDNNVQWFFNNVLKIGWACGKCMIVRRSSFERVGGFRDYLIFGEDHYLFVDLAKQGKTRYVPSIKYRHSSRRLRKLGLLKFWWTWSTNELYIIFFHRSLVKEWTPIR